MNSVTVFCGSNPGRNPRFIELAKQLGKFLADSQCRLVYGGSNVGLMGVIANATLEYHGEVVGVIPDFLSHKEVAHTQLTQLKIVDSMHERKSLMYELADAFVVLPGGLGTLDELFEVLTWAQLGLHQKPIGILNQEGYFDFLLKFIDHSAQEGFISFKHQHLLQVDASIQKLFEKLQSAASLPVS